MAASVLAMATVPAPLMLSIVLLPPLMVFDMVNVPPLATLIVLLPDNTNPFAPLKRLVPLALNVAPVKLMIFAKSTEARFKVAPVILTVPVLNAVLFDARNVPAVTLVVPA